MKRQLSSPSKRTAQTREMNKHKSQNNNKAFDFHSQHALMFSLKKSIGSSFLVCCLFDARVPTRAQAKWQSIVSMHNPLSRISRVSCSSLAVWSLVETNMVAVMIGRRDIEMCPEHCKRATNDGAACEQRLFNINHDHTSQRARTTSTRTVQTEGQGTP